jgi:hypothetical protein
VTGSYAARFGLRSHGVTSVHTPNVDMIGRRNRRYDARHDRHDVGHGPAWLTVIVVLVLAIGALVKYGFFSSVIALEHRPNAIFRTEPDEHVVARVLKNRPIVIDSP